MEPGLTRLCGEFLQEILRDLNDFHWKDNLVIHIILTSIETPLENQAFNVAGAPNESAAIL